MRKPRKSHLLQMRGLKHSDFYLSDTGQNVASFTDAWIETRFVVKSVLPLVVASFTDAWIETRRCVRKNARWDSRIFYRCVDWNRLASVSWRHREVASFTDAWIETPTRSIVPKRAVRRIFYRCVDWNNIITKNLSTKDRSHLLQMRGLKRQQNRDC